MPAQITTRAQVNGYRFLLRRLEHALIRGDSRMIHDPMRGQMRSLAVGLVIGILITGACGILAFFKPSPAIGNAQILLTKKGGALYVRIGERVHPVLNLSSARLIAGKPEQPAAVDDKKLNALPRGPVVGIIGAPNALLPNADSSTSHWTVCDTFDTPDVSTDTGTGKLLTTVLTNKPQLDREIHAADSREMLLVDYEGETYLIYDGVRAKLSNDPIVIRALHLEQAKVRPISAGLLNSFPLVEPIEPIFVDGASEPSVIRPDLRVGSIIKTNDSRGEQLYVVLRNGVQAISTATADIIRYSDAGSVRDTKEVPPSMISTVPVVHDLPIDKYPQTTPVVSDYNHDRVVCQAWEHGNTDPAAKMRLLIGHRLPMPNEAQVVQLATADGGGPGLDQAYLPPGTGEYIQTTGSGTDVGSLGSLYYVSDSGQRFHIKDLSTVSALGLTGWEDKEAKINRPQAAPWSIVSLLPPGPELSQQAALIAHDGMSADPKGLKVDPPKN
ncbi:ESX-4 secretion system protein eccB4 [Mycobacteroides abscessus subsp. abscessus]|uniref:type VII secretion protein EccB n=1 Tax=Mycobacteroides abscessus TaxID=36809 RepID=UPI000928497F|nr:type VII secretion protein EccB [Mycobacteroides abscessus]SIM22112.1 ESX-4 secretion system protein eccB4 [Mycobacteroides abscessus subsp. abscessus]SLD00798.1 ESX-4 secretion system protein eccB4 [Mycobacteroides abscessus subsp. abscessus]